MKDLEMREVTENKSLSFCKVNVQQHWKVGQCVSRRVDVHRPVMIRINNGRLCCDACHVAPMPTARKGGQRKKFHQKQKHKPLAAGSLSTAAQLLRLIAPSTAAQESGRIPKKTFD